MCWKIFIARHVLSDYGGRCAVVWQLRERSRTEQALAKISPQVPGALPSTSRFVSRYLVLWLAGFLRRLAKWQLLWLADTSLRAKQWLDFRRALINRITSIVLMKENVAS